MLKRYTARTARTAIALALTGAALLAACDQIDTRLERAREIADASVEQINGETVVNPSQRNLEKAPLLDRALAGTVMAEFAVDEEERPLFAVGSIIAKPLDIPAVEDVELADDAALIEEELDYFDSPAGEAMLEAEEAPAVGAAPAPPPPAPVVVDVPGSQDIIAEPAQALPKIKLDPRAAQETRQEIARASRDLDQAALKDDAPRLQMRRLSKDDLEAMAPEERVEVRKLARRAPVAREVVRKQLDANTVMLDTMTKYGVGGEVALSRQGQMVIQIGADGANPTQFRGPNGPADFLARAETAECPENADPDMVKEDLAVATACVVRDLRASGQFEYVEPDFIFQNQFARKPKDQPVGTPGEPRPGPSTGSNGSSGTPTTPVSHEPDDPLWTLQWHFRDRGTTDGRTAGGAGFESFWNRQGVIGSNGIVVAVVDTGLQMNHPDIAGSPNIMAGWDMVSDPRMGNDGDGRDADPNDPGDLCDPNKPGAADSFHGTHVAGTIGAAATNNGSGVAAGAWDVRIVPVRALGKCGGRLSDINDSIRWAAGLIPAELDDGTEVWNENPADIINLSIGLLGTCPASLQDAIDSATAEGVIVVSAAGNARMSTSFYAPAGCRNVITVAASDARGQIAPYSNFGPEVMLLAPGGDLTRDDNGDGKPDGVLSTKAATNCYDPVTGEGVANCYYAYEQGTSMAAPHVSAALALLKARAPGASREDLISTLRAALDPRESLQCAGLCSQYPGATPIEGSPDMCARPCGEGLLNLATVPAAEMAGGSR